RDSPRHRPAVVAGGRVIIRGGENIATDQRADPGVGGFVAVRLVGRVVTERPLGGHRHRWTGRPGGDAAALADWPRTSARAEPWKRRCSREPWPKSDFLAYLVNHVFSRGEPHFADAMRQHRARSMPGPSSDRPTFFGWLPPYRGQSCAFALTAPSGGTSCASACRSPTAPGSGRQSRSSWSSRRRAWTWRSSPRPTPSTR